MKLLIEIPDDAYKKLCSCGYVSSNLNIISVIKSGIPLDAVLDKIRAEIPKLTCGDNEYRQAVVKVADVIKCIDKHRAESEDKG